MTSLYELRLRLDYNILGRVRNQNWDLSALPPGFVIQFCADHIVRQYRHQPVRAMNPNNNNRVPRKFVFKEDSSFLSHEGMRHFLSNILDGQHIPISPEGRFLCEGGLQLVRLDATGSVMLGPQSSLPIYCMKKLVDCVVRTCKLMKNSPRVRKLVPIAIEIHTIECQQQLQRVASVTIQRQPTVKEAMKEMVVEEKITGSIPEEACSICLERLCAGQNGGRIRCTHVFHKKCILHWLENSSSCPLCRAPASSTS